MNTPKSWAVFLIEGAELDPKKISSLLHLEPHFSLPSGKNPKVDKGVWQFHSALEDSESLENHIWDILKKIAPVRKQIQELHSTFDICFYCSIEYSNNNNDGLKLGPRLLSLVGNLGVGLEIVQWNDARNNLPGNVAK